MVGKRIAKLRKSKGWTQVDLAKAARLSKGYIASIEEGDGHPRIKTVAMIAAVLGVEVRKLYEEGQDE